jgi:superfamily II DNA/RNA helicase
VTTPAFAAEHAKRDGGALMSSCECLVLDEADMLLDGSFLGQVKRCFSRRGLFLWQVKRCARELSIISCAALSLSLTPSTSSLASSIFLFFAAANFQVELVMLARKRAHRDALVHAAGGRALTFKEKKEGVARGEGRKAL